MSRLKNVAEILIEKQETIAHCLIFRYVRKHVIKIIIPPRLMIFFYIYYSLRKRGENYSGENRFPLLS